MWDWWVLRAGPMFFIGRRGSPPFLAKQRWPSKMRAFKRPALFTLLNLYALVFWGWGVNLSLSPSLASPTTNNNNRKCISHERVPTTCAFIWRTLCQIRPLRPVGPNMPLILLFVILTVMVPLPSVTVMHCHQ